MLFRTQDAVLPPEIRGVHDDPPSIQRAVRELPPTLTEPDPRPHVAQSRRNVREGVAGGQSEDEGGQFLLAHHGHGPTDGVDGGDGAVEGAVDEF